MCRYFRKKRGLFFIGAVVLTGTVLAILFWPRGSKQSDFPLLEEKGTLSYVTPPLEEQIQKSELIVDATVSEILPTEQREYHSTSEDMEEGLEEVLYYSVDPVVFTVNEVISGEIQDSFCFMLPPALSGLKPDFQVGDRFILTLIPYEDGYSTTTPVTSYFYVADDEKAYPASLKEPVARFSGMKLQDFKNELRVLKAQNPTVPD